MKRKFETIYPSTEANTNDGDITNKVEESTQFTAQLQKLKKIVRSYTREEKQSVVNLYHTKRAELVSDQATSLVIIYTNLSLLLFEVLKTCNV